MVNSRGLAEASARYEDDPSSSLGLWDLDLQSLVLRSDGGSRAILGLAEEGPDPSGRDWLRCIHPADRPLIFMKLRRVAFGGVKVVNLVYRVRRQAGGWRTLRTVGRTFEDPARPGQAVLAGTHQDISQEVALKAEARTSHALLQAIFNSTHVLIAYLDVEFRFVKVNRAYAEADGRRRPEDFIGLEHFELYPHEDNQRIFEGVRESGRAHTYHARPFAYAHAPDRGITHWDWTLSPLQDGGNSSPGFVLALVDVTARVVALEQLGESQRRFRATFDQAAVGMAQVSLDGRWLEFNDCLTAILGADRGRLEGSLWWEVVHPEDIEGLRDPLEALKRWEGESRSFMLRVVREDGAARWAQVTVSVVRNLTGSPLYFVWVVQDVHERKQVEDALQALNSTLEARIAEEVAENRKKDLILIQKSRQAALGEMIGNIAHQWRQPLNALGLILANLEDANLYGELNPAMLKDKSEQAKTIIRGMSDTIDSFRSFFRPGRAKQVFLPSIAVHDAVSMVEGGLSMQGVQLSVEVKSELSILGFPNEYMQVVLSLLENAKLVIEERDVAQGWIQVVVEASDGQVSVEVSDNGGGVDPNIVDRIFEPYFSTRDSGTGIGLYMSKMLVERNMGGRIGVENRGDGAVFRVVTPGQVRELGR